MPSHPSTAASLRAVQGYLEVEFPGCVEATRENVLVVSQDGLRHHIALDATFLRQCPDSMLAIRESELADYIRETRSGARRFLVCWQERTTRIRITSL